MAVRGRPRLRGSSFLSTVALLGVAWTVCAGQVAGITVWLAVCETHLETPRNTPLGLG